MYLEKIKSPKDIKGLGIEELKVLANEIRNGILNRVSNHGGHVGPNLGITEATIALNVVFDAPTDKFVYDISHQIYPHKMLTGRAFGFTETSRINDVSGYSSPLEDPVYDNFEIGHTSTSIALATGLQKGRDILGGTENVIAIIGDGSLSGGEAFEGLDTAAEIGTNIIIVVNDNEMSIAENHGGLYNNLRLLRETKGQAELNFFKAFGFDYYYEEYGNDIKALIDIFKKVKDTPRPTVVHIHTEKGHGYQPAIDNKEGFHWRGPFELATGELKGNGGESMASLLGTWLSEEIKKDPKLVCIAAGVPDAIAFSPQRRAEAGKQFIDVGIAEEEAVALASGIAKRGARPVFSTYATFFQRTYDQLAQDLCVNGNPAVLNIIGSSIYGMSDFTHICFFDIPMLSHIPNLVYLAPTTYEELIAMESWAIKQDKYSVAIRVPACNVLHSSQAYDTDYSDLDKFKLDKKGEKVAVIAAGDFYEKGLNVVGVLEAKGINATLINPRFLTGIDESMLNELKTNHSVVATIEDGCLDGGFGERIARYYGPSDMKVLNFGVKKSLYDRYDIDTLLKENHLTDEQIVSDILALL